MRSDAPPLPPDLREVLDAEPDGDTLATVWLQLTPSDPAAPDWASLRDRIASERPRRATDRAPAPSRASRSRRWVATGVGTLLVGAVAWLAVPVTHQAPLGDTLRVALADGSVATLNSGATLRHARLAWGDRDVTLDGEAFFEVEPSETRFVVSTHNAQVEVLGTAFNVRAWAGEAATTVALVHGRVQVRGAGPETEDLTPGQMAVVRTDAAPVAEVADDIARATAWRDGALVFEALPLEAVLVEVERRYGVSFVTQSGVPLAASISAFYAERPALDALLGDLGTAAGVQFEPGESGVEVRPTRARRPTSAPPPTVAP